MELELFDADPVGHVPTFDEWYARYPKHQGKAEARKRWAKMSPPERASAWAALPAWERYAAVEGKTYLPMASTWLNQSRWEDDAPTPTPAPLTKADHNQARIAAYVERNTQPTRVPLGLPKGSTQ